MCCWRALQLEIRTACPRGGCLLCGVQDASDGPVLRGWAQTWRKQEKGEAWGVRSCSQSRAPACAARWGHCLLVGTLLASQDLFSGCSC